MPDYYLSGYSFRLEMLERGIENEVVIYITEEVITDGRGNFWSAETGHYLEGEELKKAIPRIYCTRI